jgi:hypothetical protein
MLERACAGPVLCRREAASDIAPHGLRTCWRSTGWFRWHGLWLVIALAFVVDRFACRRVRRGGSGKSSDPVGDS